MKKFTNLILLSLLALGLASCNDADKSENLTSLGVVGTFSSYSWTSELALVKNASNVWEASFTADQGDEFMIRANGGDTYKWGFSDITSNTAGILTNNSGKAVAVGAGTYTISIVAPAKLSPKAKALTSFAVAFIEGEITYGNDFYNGYYDDINTWENGEDLKSKLYTIINDGYQALPYNSPNWETNQYADQALDDFGKVDIVYDIVNQDKTDTYSSGSGWQREHAFAASLMTGKLTSAATGTLGRATDFHNLFASSSSGNGSRGNKNFGVATGDVAIVEDKGNIKYSYDELNFEPSDYDKGRLTRAIFYMGVMYSVSENAIYEPLTIQEEYVSYVTNVAPYAIGNLSTLLSWNDFPVDRLEYQHNESVYSHIYSGTSKAQGNRNPFVDYPELVDHVYGDKKDEAGALTYLKPSYLNLEIDKGSELANYALSNAKRSYNVGETFTKSDYTLVEVSKDYTTKANTTFVDSTADYTFTASDLGVKTFSIVTPINTIQLPVAVTNADPMLACSYQYKLTGKATGKDLAGFTNGNSVNFGGTSWRISWSNTEAAIGNTDSVFGVAFGSGTAGKSVNSITLKTIASLSVNAFYAKIYCASGKTINYTMKIGAATIKSGSVTRPSGATAPETVGINLAASMVGELSILIDGTGASTGAVYIHSLAYNVA